MIGIREWLMGVVCRATSAKRKACQLSSVRLRLLKRTLLPKSRPQLPAGLAKILLARAMLQKDRNALLGPVPSAKERQSPSLALLLRHRKLKTRPRSSQRRRPKANLARLRASQRQRPTPKTRLHPRPARMRKPAERRRKALPSPRTQVCLQAVGCGLCLANWMLGYRRGGAPGKEAFRT